MKDKISRGYFGIGIYGCKKEVNIGTLWRSASAFGANYLFTIGSRYTKQSSDTTKSWRHTPLFHYRNWQHFKMSILYSCLLIGVELLDNATCLFKFCHPERCIYLLGAEDNGLPDFVTKQCHRIVQIPTNVCLNVATTGSIVMYDRKMKGQK